MLTSKTDPGHENATKNDERISPGKGISASAVSHLPFNGGIPSLEHGNKQPETLNRLRPYRCSESDKRGIKCFPSRKGKGVKLCSSFSHAKRCAPSLAIISDDWISGQGKSASSSGYSLLYNLLPAPRDRQDNNNAEPLGNELTRLMVPEGVSGILGTDPLSVGILPPKDRNSANTRMDSLSGGIPFPKNKSSKFVLAPRLNSFVCEVKRANRTRIANLTKSVKLEGREESSSVPSHLLLSSKELTPSPQECASSVKPDVNRPNEFS